MIIHRIYNLSITHIELSFLPCPLESILLSALYMLCAPKFLSYPIGINPPALHFLVLCTVKILISTHWNLPPNLYFFFRSCTLQRHLLFYRFRIYKNLFRALLQSPYGNQMNNDPLLIDVFILPLAFEFVNTIFDFLVNIFTILAAH